MLDAIEFIKITITYEILHNSLNKNKIMANNFAPMSFLRKCSNMLLDEYFKAKSVAISSDLNENNETKVVDIHEAIIAFDSTTRDNIITDFRIISDFATDSGIKHLIESANKKPTRIYTIMGDKLGDYLILKLCK